MISKLPKWAQSEMATLTRDIETLRKRITEMTSSEPSCIQYQVGMEKPVNIPKYSRLIMHLPTVKGPRRIHAIVIERNGTTSLEIQCDGMMTISPIASNAANITTD